MSAAQSAGQNGPLDEVRHLVESLASRMRHEVQGRDDVIRLVLTALMADGHVLLEDHPGSGKTTLVKALGVSLVASADKAGLATFRRIQFTSDLLPSDITGVTLFDLNSRTFEFRRGPIFAHVVLADEINRAGPRVQSALLESMAEKQVTVDDTSHRLDDLFFVVATQNPVDLMGTYPLPRAQLDRFLFKIKMKPLARVSQLEVLSRKRTYTALASSDLMGTARVVEARRVIHSSVEVSAVIHEALVDLAEAVQQDPRVTLGLSTRALVQAVPCLQTWAVLCGRDHVQLQDLVDLSTPLFAHRLTLASGSDSAAQVLEERLRPVIERHTRQTLRS